MAIQSAIPVSFEAFFPRGAFVVGEVEPIIKWSDDGQRQGQEGLPRVLLTVGGWGDQAASASL